MESLLEKLVRQCTVRIQIIVDQQKKFGTGFFVAPGLVLTCAHVVEAPRDTNELSINVHWNDETYPAQVNHLLSAPYPDLCLLGSFKV